MRAVLFLILLLLASGQALAQLPPARAANLAQLKADPTAAGIERTLAALPATDAMVAAQDFADDLLKAGALSPLEHAQLRRGIVEHFLPPDEDGAAAREYWAYRVMVAARFDRGEIPREEYDYLIEKAVNDARRGIAQRGAQQQAASQSDRAAVIANMLRGFGRALQPPPPPVHCSSVQFGSTVSTVCR